MSSPKAANGKRPVENFQFLNPAPDHLRALVLDYLCHNCHTETARAFARDSAVRHLDADGDEIMPPGKETGDTSTDRTDSVLRLVEVRQQIRIHILSGRVDEATKLLNEHFPLVLSEAEPYTSQRKSIPGRVEAIAPTSVDPTHLSLNLRILAFTEASRTVPLQYDPHPERRDEPTSSALSDISAPSLTSPMYDHDDPETKLTELLFLAQKLYLSASLLQNASARGTYLEELGHVGGLLAYKHPENSPMAKYLSQERREAVADQINSAILYRTGRPAVSNLELYTRYTSAVWSLMHDLGMKSPPLAKRPSGVLLPPTDRGRTANPPSMKSSAEKVGSEPVPPFDLRQFLDAKT